jgi:DNA repair protein RadA/Sms
MVGKSSSKVKYICDHCGGIASKWAGQCAQCGEWNSFTEMVTQDRRSLHGLKAEPVGRIKPSVLGDVSLDTVARSASGLFELDRVLGGGLVPGSAILLGGDPGIGKSTLALQCIGHLQHAQRVLYVSGEESLQQIAMRAQRLGIGRADIHVLGENEVQLITRHALDIGAQFLVADSIQTLFHAEVPSGPGSVAQVRECASALVSFAKQTGCTVLLIGHVTKEGGIAGPKVLEHLVDTVLYFEGDHSSRFRLIRAFKNRYGTVNEIGVFAMTEDGLREVSNPSSMFLSQDREAAPGSVVFALQEATRPLLVEVQALVDNSTVGHPRRVCVGFDPQRLGMLLAVLHRHLEVPAVERDVFVNVAGGIRLSETAADLAVTTALYASAVNRSFPANTVCFGEVGLSGEIRPVPWGESRIHEAASLGFVCAVIPARNTIKNLPIGFETVPIASLAELVNWMETRSQVDG